MRIDLVAKTLEGWSRLSPAQREKFFQAGLKAALRLGGPEFRRRLLRRVRTAVVAAPIDPARFAFGVKRFQTIHHCSVDVARGLVLLFGIGTRALPSWGSRTRRNDLLGGLTVDWRQVQADIRTHLIHRPARDIIPPRGGAQVSSYRI